MVYNINMSAEKDPSLPLNLGNGRTLEMTPNNSTMYTFLGKTAVRCGNDEFEIDNSTVNHIFVATEENRGLYFFAHQGEPFNEMSRFMIENSYPMILNSRSVPTCDLQVWLQEVDKEAADFASKIPDSFSDK